MKLFETLGIERTSTGELSFTGEALIEGKILSDGTETYSIMTGRDLFDLVPGEERLLQPESGEPNLSGTWFKEFTCGKRRVIFRTLEPPESQIK
jgi:hypothetical protein